MSHIRRAITLSIEGLNQNTQDLILESWKPNTSKQYSVHLNKWDTYCSQHNISPKFASVTDGLNFLSQCYNGYSYSALNTARSALSTVILLPSHSPTFGRAFTW